MTPEVVGPDGVEAASRRIRASGRIALDTEFHAEHRYLPELFLVQLGLADGSVLLVDPLVPRVLDGLSAALRDVPWVAHAAEHDVRILAWLLGGLPPAVFDTQIAAGLVCPEYPMSYAAACRRWLGEEVDKGETLSDWSRRPLTPAQLAYAAADVVHLCALEGALRAELRRLGREAIFEAACAEAVATAVAPASAERAFGELAAGTALDGAGPGILLGLLRWRDQKARAANQPPRGIVPDAVLLDLARKAPASVEQLRQNRRLSKAVARHADEIVAVIAGPLPAAPPIVRRNSSHARVSAFYQLLAQVLGEARAFSARLALPRELADRAALGDPAIPGWRAELLGEELRSAAAGGGALAVAGGDVAFRAP